MSKSAIDTAASHLVSLRETAPTNEDLAVLDQHGVAGVLAQAWMTKDASIPLPQALKTLRTNAALQHSLQMNAARSAVRLFRSAGIDSIVFKGGALSHQIYAAGERPHCDIDILISESHRHRAIDLIKGQGFEQNLSLAGGELMHQLLFRRWVGEAVLRIDLHWRFSNRPVLNQSITVDRVFAQSVELAVGNNATVRAPSIEAGLLLACAHLAGHHHDETPRLIWLIDIARLWNAGNHHKIQLLASEWGVSGLLAHGLELAQRYAPEEMGELPLAELKEAGIKQQASRLLSGGGPLHDIVLDLSALPELSRKFRYLADTALPSSAYMAQRYDLKSRWQLPAAHIRRWCSGAVKLLAGRRRNANH
ncbi:MAG: hypothetical protein DHS20C11_36700 [Lysobacteraceae bacterium]|nr:MAG: hypothetical protein DHS20C11_36700 [Xanthomonadaceae bacterium]